MKQDIERDTQSCKIFYAALIVTVLALYAKTLNVWFVGEEYHLLWAFDNADYNLLFRYFIRPVSGLHTADFTYRPIWYLYWGAVYKIFGMTPLVYHLNIITLHLLNVILFFACIKILFNRSIAFSAALIYGINPVSICVGAWWNSSCDLFFQFFLMSAFLCYLKIQRKKLKHQILISLLFVLSLMTKENGILFPVVIFLTEFFLLGKDRKINDKILDFIKNNLYILIITAVYILFRLFIFKSYSTYGGAPKVTFQLITVVLLRRLRIAALYDVILTDLQLSTAKVAVLNIFVIFIFIIAATIAIKKKIIDLRIILFCICGYVITSLPVINLSQSIRSYKLIMNTRYIYFPMIFYCLFFAYSVEKFFHFRLKNIIIILYCIFLLYKTIPRIDLYVEAANISKNRWDWVIELVKKQPEISLPDFKTLVTHLPPVKHKTLHSEQIEAVYEKQLILAKKTILLEKLK